MEHIAKIVWRPLNWLPESPDQYADGLPPAKPEVAVISWSGEPTFLPAGGALEGGGLMVMGLQFGDRIVLREIDAEGHTQGQPVLTIPADRLHDVVNALLYVHRRTREHDYEDSPYGITEAPESGAEG